MINGDLIERCEGCTYCPFEEILTLKQRNSEVLEQPISHRHPHRGIIEEVCGKRYDEVCEMKYAMMRTGLSDFDVAQFGLVIKDFCNDLSKNEKREIRGVEAFPIWVKKRDLGRGFEESYAGRFREVWDLGLREFAGESESFQALSELSIYEIIVSENYDVQLAALKQRICEFKKRDEEGLKS
ncbi:hypothetical protein CMI37_07810 [Candidatus Pacearchaeota archaeon]|nr:hypothetical protein [Candidatus Pacearchaeota archaeon]|tara:strand:- start:11105 stop:11653 length:549 start_codon:yes stop_codon:yes gene_type:complete